jgi:hypothetical protein
MNPSDFLILIGLAAAVVLTSWVTGKFSKAVHSTLCNRGGRIDVSASGPISRSKIPNISIHEIQSVETFHDLSPIAALGMAFSSVGYFAPLGGKVVKVTFKTEHSTGYIVVTEIASDLGSLPTSSTPASS